MHLLNRFHKYFHETLLPFYSLSVICMEMNCTVGVGVQLQMAKWNGRDESAKKEEYKGVEGPAKWDEDGGKRRGKGCSAVMSNGKETNLPGQAQTQEYSQGNVKQHWWCCCCHCFCFNSTTTIKGVKGVKGGQSVMPKENEKQTEIVVKDIRINSRESKGK